MIASGHLTNSIHDVVEAEDSSLFREPSARCCLSECTFQLP
jgi:hypothetical protein